MFKCKGCKAKDEHLKAQADEIAYLRLLVFPHNDGFEPHVIAREADAVISADTSVRTVHPSQEQDLSKLNSDAMTDEQIMSERDRILTGTY